MSCKSLAEKGMQEVQQMTARQQGHFVWADAKVVTPEIQEQVPDCMQRVSDCCQNVGILSRLMCSIMSAS